MRWPEFWARHGRRIGAVLGLAALAFVLAQLWLYREQAHAFLAQAHLPKLAASLILAILAQAAFGIGWVCLLQSGGSGVAPLRAFSAWSLSLLARYLPGKIWHPVLRKSIHDDALDGVLGRYACEQLIAVGIACFLAALSPPESLPLRAHALYQSGLAAMGMIMLGATTSRASFLLPAWVRRRYSPLSSRGLFQFILACLIGYGLMAAGFRLLIAELAQVAPDFTTAASGLCLAGIMGIAAFFIPAGLGVREAGIYWYFAPLIGPAPATLLAVLSRIWLTCADLSIAAIGGMLRIATKEAGQ